MWSDFLAWRYRKFRSDLNFYEIKPKLSKSEQKSPVILEAWKRQTTFWNCRGLYWNRCFVTINPRMLIFGLRINAVNHFKDQSRPVNRLDTVMFRGTPCITLKWGTFSAPWYFQMSLYFQSFCFTCCYFYHYSLYYLHFWNIIIVCFCHIIYFRCHSVYPGPKIKNLGVYYATITG